MLFNDDLFRNGDGYADPTAYEALKRIEEEKKTYIDKISEDVETILAIKLKDAEDKERRRKLIGAILRIAELSDFEITCRITLRDLRTGKEWN